MKRMSVALCFVLVMFLGMRHGTTASPYCSSLWDGYACMPGLADCVIDDCADVCDSCCEEHGWGDGNPQDVFCGTPRDSPPPSDGFYWCGCDCTCTGS